VAAFHTHVVDAEVQDARVPAREAENLVGVLEYRVSRQVAHLFIGGRGGMSGLSPSTIAHAVVEQDRRPRTAAKPRTGPAHTAS